MSIKIDLKHADTKELYCYEIALLNTVVNLQNEIADIRARRKELEDKQKKEN
jgi:hypothetical protein